MIIKRILAASAAFLCCVSMLVSCSDSKADSSSSLNSNVSESSVSSADSADSDKASDSSSEDSAALSDSSQTDETENKEPSDITPAMWVVTSPEGNEMTLLGSMHALKDEDYPLPDKIMNAYNSADVLAVECDITKTQSFTYQLSLMKQMVYDNGDTLQDHISEEAYNILSDYFKNAKMNISLYNTYKPWAISSLLDSIGIMSSGLNAEKGIDSYLMSCAHKEDKEIYEVESVDFQMDLMMNFSDEIYEAMFMSYEGETAESQAELLIELYDAWRTGDIDKIHEMDEPEQDEELTEEEAAILEDYNEQMLYNRNITMEEAIKSLIDGDKKVFYVVGAAHYPGEGGILDLLEKDGYTVERIEY